MKKRKTEPIFYTHLFGGQQRVQTATVTQGLKNVLLLNAFEMHLLIPEIR